MTYRSEVSAEVFAKIRQRQLTIEARLNDTIHQKLRIGDLILFTDRETGDEQLAKVVGLLRYSSFAELFNSYPPDRFGAKSTQELVGYTHRIYTSQQETEHGVVGLKLHLLKG